jgi:hypothetical protein
MNNNKDIKVAIRIRWYKASEGGRETLPKGPIYGANVRFGNDPQLWSIVLIMEDSIQDEKGYQVLRAGFLFPEKVNNFLTIGQRIIITEGPTKVVAEGEILEKLE